MATGNHAAYIETSAKLGKNVGECLDPLPIPPAVRRHRRPRCRRVASRRCNVR
jgi:hypothetical protein